MPRRNEVLDAAVQELTAAGVPFEIVERTDHMQVRFPAKGKERFVTVGRSSSDPHAQHNTRARVRRILEGREPGDIVQDQSVPAAPAEPKPAGEPPRPLSNPPQPPTERWISAAEAGEFLGLCPSSMSRMASTGAIKARKVPGRGRGGSLEFEEQSVLQRALSHPPRVKAPPPPQVPAPVVPSPPKVSPLAPIVVDDAEEIGLAAAAEGMTEPEYRRMALDMALVTSRARHNGGMPFGKATDPALAAIVQAEVRRQLANGGRKP